MMENTIGMVRPVFESKQYWLDYWKQKDVTVLITQRNTHDLIRLTLESLLRFYPDVPVLVVDGDSTDDSLAYLRYMAKKHENVSLWERMNKEGGKHTSHGITMHEALTTKIKTKYVLLMDSDVITERGRLIDDLLFSFYGNDNQYAIGALMNVSKEGEGCAGAPQSDEDTVQYAHPQCSMIDREKYIELCSWVIEFKGLYIKGEFGDHGAPLIWNMIAAKEKGYDVNFYPVNEFTSHLSGASWTEPRTIWPDDHDVYLRPFVTFIISRHEGICQQSNNNYECLIEGDAVCPFNVVIHGQQPVAGQNLLYPMRFNVRGEYVCNINDCKYPAPVNYHTVRYAIEAAVKKNLPDEFEMEGLKFISRKVWQKTYCLQND